MLQPGRRYSIMVTPRSAEGYKGNDSSGSKSQEMETPMVNSAIDGAKTKRKAERVPDFLFSKWVVYGCCLVNYTLSLGLPMALSSLFRDWQAAFRVSRAHTATVYSTSISILFGAAILPGYMMNRLGPRFTILLGSCMAFLGCVLSCFATSIDYLIFSTGVLGGLGGCFIQLPSMPTINTVSPPRYRSLAVTVCTCGVALGSMALPFLYRHLVHQYSWRGTFAIISGFYLNTMIFGLIMTSYKKQSSSAEEHQKKESYPLSNKNDGQSKLKDDFDINDETKCIDDNGNKAGESPNKIKASQPDEQCRVFIGRFPRLQSVLSRIKSSRWKFVVDFMYIAVVIHLCTCMATVYGFLVMMMDFTHTKGFHEESTGLFFFSVFFITSLIGRLISGLLNMVPCIHSIMLMAAFGIVASFALIMLGQATEYAALVAFMALKGIGAGGMFAIYTKCSLDVDSVDLSTYPLALGLSGTLEGFFDFIIPILIGYSVDKSGSYAMVLQWLGIVAMITSLFLIVVKSWSMCQSNKKTKQSFIDFPTHRATE